jgi:hypothetical protein
MDRHQQKWGKLYLKYNLYTVSIQNWYIKYPKNQIPPIKRGKLYFKCNLYTVWFAPLPATNAARVRDVCQLDEGELEDAAWARVDIGEGAAMVQESPCRSITLASKSF